MKTERGGHLSFRYIIVCWGTCSDVKLLYSGVHGAILSFNVVCVGSLCYEKINKQTSSRNFIGIKLIKAKK